MTPLPLDEANAINERGQVAGTRHGRSALWQKNRVQDLGTLPLPGSPPGAESPQSAAVALNDRGLVAGNSGRFQTYPFDVGDGFDSLPFLWGSGRMLPLGTLGGQYAEAAAINAEGVVAGKADLPLIYDRKRDAEDNRTRAFLWRKGKMRSLGTLGGHDSGAQGINNRGQVVGWSMLRPRTKARDDIGLYRAFLWEKGRMRDLGSIPGFAESSATAINDRGQIVGELYRTHLDYRTTSRAFLWEKGRMRNLGAPAGLSSTALAINDRGEVVGFAQTPSFDHRALLWKAGRIDDLNVFLPPGTAWRLNEARGINNRGQIVGAGTWKGVPRGFLLTPQRRKASPAPEEPALAARGPARPDSGHADSAY